MSASSQTLVQLESALRQGDVSAARKLLEQAEKLDARSPDVAVARARLEAASGDAAKAEQTLRDTLEANPKHAGAMGYLGAVLVEQRRHDEAKPLLEQAVLAGDTPPAVKRAWGRNLAARGDLKRGLLFLEQAAEEGPTVAAAHYDLAVAYGELGKAKKAAESFVRVVKLDPKHLVAWGMLIRMQAASDPKAAQKLLEEAEKHNPGEPSLARVRAELLLDAGRLDEGLLALDALPDSEKDAETYAATAWIRMQKKQWKEAVVAAKASVAKDPAYWRAQYTLGVALESEQPLNRAAVEGAYEAALKGGDPRGEAATRYGFMLLEDVPGQAPRTTKAIELLEAARARSNDAPSTLLNLAIAYKQAGENAKAKALGVKLLAVKGLSQGMQEQAQRLAKG